FDLGHHVNVQPLLRACPESPQPVLPELLVVPRIGAREHRFPVERAEGGLVTERVAALLRRHPDEGGDTAPCPQGGGGRALVPCGRIDQRPPLAATKCLEGGMPVEQ